MGDPSCQFECDLEVLDLEKFEAWLSAEFVCKGQWDYINTLKKNEEGKWEVDWDNMKIYSYFYDEYCKFVNDLWHHGVRGEVYLCFVGDKDLNFKIIFDKDPKMKVWCHVYEAEIRNDETEEYEIDKTFVPQKFYIRYFKDGKKNLVDFE